MGGGVENKGHVLSLLLNCYYYYYYCYYLLTAIQLSLGGSSPYIGTDKTNNNKYTQTKQYKTQYKQYKTQ